MLNLFLQKTEGGAFVAEKTKEVFVQPEVTAEEIEKQRQQQEKELFIYVILYIIYY